MDNEQKKINPFQKKIKKRLLIKFLVSMLQLIGKIFFDIFMVTFIALLAVVITSYFGMFNFLKKPIETIIAENTSYYLKIKGNIHLNLLTGSNAIFTLSGISVSPQKDKIPMIKLNSIEIKIPTAQFLKKFDLHVLKINSFKVDDFKLLDNKDSKYNIEHFIKQLSTINKERKIEFVGNNNQSSKTFALDINQIKLSNLQYILQTKNKSRSITVKNLQSTLKAAFRPQKFIFAHLNTKKLDLLYDTNGIEQKSTTSLSMQAPKLCAIEIKQNLKNQNISLMFQGQKNSLKLKQQIKKNGKLQRNSIVNLAKLNYKADTNLLKWQLSNIDLKFTTQAIIENNQDKQMLKVQEKKISCTTQLQIKSTHQIPQLATGSFNLKFDGMQIEQNKKKYKLSKTQFSFVLGKKSFVKATTSFNSKIYNMLINLPSAVQLFNPTIKQVNFTVKMSQNKNIQVGIKGQMMKKAKIGIIKFLAKANLQDLGLKKIDKNRFAIDAKSQAKLTGKIQFNARKLQNIQIKIAPLILSLGKQEINFDNISLNYKEDQLYLKILVKALKLYWINDPKKQSLNVLESKLSELQTKLKSAEKKQIKSKGLKRKVVNSAVKSLFKGLISGVIIGNPSIGGVNKFNFAQEIGTTLVNDALATFYHNILNTKISRKNISIFSKDKLNLPINLINKLAMLNLKIQKVILNDTKYGNVIINTHVSSGNVHMILQNKNKYLSSDNEIKAKLNQHLVDADFKSVITIHKPKHFIPSNPILDLQKTRIHHIVTKLNSKIRGSSIAEIVRTLKGDCKINLSAPSIIIMKFKKFGQELVHKLFSSFSKIDIRKLKLGCYVDKGIVNLNGDIFTDIADFTVTKESFVDINSLKFDIWLKIILTQFSPKHEVVSRVFLADIKQKVLIGINKKNMQPIIKHFSSFKSLVDLL